MNNCSICFEGYDQDRPALHTPCKHTFHTECLKTWCKACSKAVHIPCPICRYNLHHTISDLFPNEQWVIIRKAFIQCTGDIVFKVLNMVYANDSIDKEIFENPADIKPFVLCCLSSYFSGANAL